MGYGFGTQGIRYQHGFIKISKDNGHRFKGTLSRTEQKGDSMSFLREIIENIKLADWNTFCEEAASIHVFMAFTRDEEAKRACYKILSDLPQGDTKALMTKISSIEAFPDNKSVSVKPTINKDEIKKKVCTECKFKGHLASDFWGKCQHCGRYGHKSQVCRTKPQQQSEPVKKTSDDKKKRKFKKKKVKKENAKRVAELQEIVQTLTLNTPAISSEDETSSSDSESSSSQAVMRVQVQQPQAPQTRREQHANVYAGLISDKKVID